MSLGPHFDLCKCGCSEAEHESELAVSVTSGRTTTIRGKCLGFRYQLPQHEEPQVPIEGYVPEKGEIIKVPCECTEFRPIFENQCHGFGF